MHKTGFQSHRFSGKFPVSSSMVFTSCKQKCVGQIYSGPPLRFKRDIFIQPFGWLSLCKTNSWMCLTKLLTVFPAIQSSSYGPRFPGRLWNGKEPLLPCTHGTRSLVNVTSGCRGKAERKDTLLLTLERALFKFNAATPPLEVLLKLEPRIGTASPL